MAQLKYDNTGRLIFTKEMKNEYTILAPMMAPIHFTLICKVFTHYGYNVELLDTDGPEICLLYTSPSPRDGLLYRMPYYS